jgi:hypothetical protein
MIIDGYKQDFPARTSAPVTTVASSPMAGLLDPAQLLRVDVYEVTRIFVLVTLYWLGRFQVRQSCQAGAGEHAAYRSL